MRDVFVSARGQHDNLGDSVLRRGLLDALRPLGSLHVNVAGLSDGYLGALGLGADDVLVREGWGGLLVRGAARGYVYGFNAGETYANPAYAAHCAKMAPLLALSRARGGSAFHVGLGLRSPNRAWAGVLRASLAVCDELAWRDAQSLRWVGRGRVAPDWAYASGAPDDVVRAGTETAARGLMVVSLRFDRPRPDERWLAVVRRLAHDRGLDVVVAPQVGRDSQRAAELASALDGDLVDWDGVDHAKAELRVRELYSRAQLVVSDRLHALIIGHTEGAVPLGLGTADVGKLRRTLAVVGLSDCAWEPAGSSLEESLDRVARLEERRGEVLEGVVRARAELADLRERMRAVAAR